ncbi:alcohol dehydrogenase catalytic domain-containing protein, partial [Mesorhizobium sp.]
MKAARLYGPGDLRVEDIAPPGVPGAGWVKLRVDAAGICGSDLHNFRTGRWISRSPSTAGHELTGTVTAIGAGVDAFAVGDRVVADSRFWCGDCAQCHGGRRQLCASLGFVGEVCDGGFAEQAVLPARLLHIIDAGLDERVAAMAEPLAVALHAVRRLPKTAGSVLVVGCGPIGGLAALLLSRTFAGTVLVADRNQARSARVSQVTGAR